MDINFPTLEELERRYKKVMDNPNITMINNMREINKDKPTDEAAFLERGVKNAAALKNKIKTIDNLLAKGN